jgi:hypothetical protein
MTGWTNKREEKEYGRKEVIQHRYKRENRKVLLSTHLGQVMGWCAKTPRDAVIIFP